MQISWYSIQTMENPVALYKECVKWSTAFTFQANWILSKYCNSQQKYRIQFSAIEEILCKIKDLRGNGWVFCYQWTNAESEQSTLVTHQNVPCTIIKKFRSFEINTGKIHYRGIFFIMQCRSWGETLNCPAVNEQVQSLVNQYWNSDYGEQFICNGAIIWCLFDVLQGWVICSLPFALSRCSSITEQVQSEVISPEVIDHGWGGEHLSSLQGRNTAEEAPVHLVKVDYIPSMFTIVALKFLKSSMTHLAKVPS